MSENIQNTSTEDSTAAIAETIELLNTPNSKKGAVVLLYDFASGVSKMLTINLNALAIEALLGFGVTTNFPKITAEFNELKDELKKLNEAQSYNLAKESPLEGEII